MWSPTRRRHNTSDDGGILKDEDAAPTIHEYLRARELVPASMARRKSSARSRKLLTRRQNLVVITSPKRSNLSSSSNIDRIQRSPTRDLARGLSVTTLYQADVASAVNNNTNNNNGTVAMDSQTTVSETSGSTIMDSSEHDISDHVMGSGDEAQREGEGDHDQQLLEDFEKTFPEDSLSEVELEDVSPTVASVTASSSTGGSWPFVEFTRRVAGTTPPSYPSTNQEVTPTLTHRNSATSLSSTTSVGSSSSSTSTVVAVASSGNNTVRRPSVISRHREMLETKISDLSRVHYLAAKRLPSVLRESEFNLEGYDKVFTSMWLNDTDVVMGTKCNRIVVLNTVTGKKVEIPAIWNHYHYNHLPAQGPATMRDTTTPPPLRVETSAASAAMMTQGISNLFSWRWISPTAFLHSRTAATFLSQQHRPHLLPTVASIPNQNQNQTHPQHPVTSPTRTSPTTTTQAPPGPTLTITPSIVATANNHINNNNNPNRTLQCQGIHSISSNPSRSLLAVGGSRDSTVKLWNVGGGGNRNTRREIFVEDDDGMGYIGRRYYDDDDNGNGSRKIDVLSPYSSCEGIHRGKVRDLKYNRRSLQVATLSTEGALRLFDVNRITSSSSSSSSKSRSGSGGNDSNMGSGWPVAQTIRLSHTTETVCLATTSTYVFASASSASTATTQGEQQQQQHQPTNNPHFSDLYAVGSQSHVSLIDPRVSTRPVVHAIESRDSGWGVRSVCLDGGPGWNPSFGVGAFKCGYASGRCGDPGRRRRFDGGCEGDADDEGTDDDSLDCMNVDSVGSGGAVGAVSGGAGGGRIITKGDGGDVGIGGGNDLTASGATTTSASSSAVSYLETGKGWLRRDPNFVETFQGQHIRNAVYTLSYDAAGVKLFAAGGPLQLNVCGSYAGLWN
ncbi:DDB1- and CUL4-associated factor 12 [Blyttiomyces sp. JEL0837]|nr:DDB1- and CUL4-associated factor 12 [Blyttiomyces sp. JEL0837]